MKNWLFLALFITHQAMGSALFDNTNAKYWLFEDNGAVSSFNYDTWLDQFSASVYVLEPGDQVLINAIPNSSIAMDSQLSPLSLNGLGAASRGVNQTGGDLLLVEPAGNLVAPLM